MAPVGIGTELEGIHAVEAALTRGRVTALFVEKRRVERDDIMRLVEIARSQSIPVEVVEDVRSISTTDAPQGVYARANSIEVNSLKSAVGISGLPALLVLDHVEDPRNIGALARSAVAAGITALVLPKRRSAPIGATAFKAAAGALEEIPLVVVSSIADALRQLDRMDVWSVGLDGGGDRSLLSLDLLSEPVAICIGGEGEGLSKLVAERCDVLAKIPMVGGTESLNASVAGAIASYEVARVRGWLS